MDDYRVIIRRIEGEFDTIDDNYTFINNAYNVIVKKEAFTLTTGYDMLTFDLSYDDYLTYYNREAVFACENVVTLTLSEPRFAKGYYIRKVEIDKANKKVSVYAEGEMYKWLYEPLSMAKAVKYTGTAQEHLERIDPFIFYVGSTPMSMLEIQNSAPYTSDKTIRYYKTDTKMTAIRRVLKAYGGHLYLDKTSLRMFNTLPTESDHVFIYGRNVFNIKRTIDTTEVYNKVRPIGKDGIDITSVNGGLDYVEDDSQKTYGTANWDKTYIAINEDIEDPTTLLDYANSILEQVRDIKPTYEITLDYKGGIYDIYTPIKIIDFEMDLNEYRYVISFERNYSEPYKSSVVIETKKKDTSTTIAEQNQRISNLENELDDTGYKTLTGSLGSNFQLYDTNSKVEYRQYGRVVEIAGALKPTQTLTGSSTELLMFTLPTEVAPRRKRRILMQGSTQGIWLFTVNTSGECYFSRYREGASYVDADTTTWLPFQATYLI